MTNATPEQLDLARKIAADTGFTGWVRNVAETAALAAIIETTERAAKLVEEALYSTVRVDAVDSPVRWNRRSIAAALRNQEHLKK